MVIVTPWVIIIVIFIIISMHLLDHGILSIALHWPGVVGLAEYVCAHVFVIVVFSQLILTLTPEILSSWRLHPSRVPKG
jgi:hypothetical protein